MADFIETLNYGWSSFMEHGTVIGDNISFLSRCLTEECRKSIENSGSKNRNVCKDCKQNFCAITEHCEGRDGSRLKPPSFSKKRIYPFLVETLKKGSEIYSL